MRLAPSVGEVPDAIGHLTIEQVFVVVAFLISVLAIALYLRKIVKPSVDALRNFLSDWNGEPARAGFEAQPGVMERLQKLETDMQHVVHEVQPNSGHSMHDKIDRMSKVITPEGERRGQST